eukprot:tig00001376_g8526.t1
MSGSGRSLAAGAARAFHGVRALHVQRARLPGGLGHALTYSQFRAMLQNTSIRWSQSAAADGKREAGVDKRKAGEEKRKAAEEKRKAGKDDDDEDAEFIPEEEPIREEGREGRPEEEEDAGKSQQNTNKRKKRKRLYDSKQVAFWRLKLKWKKIRRDEKRRVKLALKTGEMGKREARRQLRRLNKQRKAEKKKLRKKYIAEFLNSGEDFVAYGWKEAVAAYPAFPKQWAKGKVTLRHEMNSLRNRARRLVRPVAYYLKAATVFLLQSLARPSLLLPRAPPRPPPQQPPAGTLEGPAPQETPEGASNRER